MKIFVFNGRRTLRAVRICALLLVFAFLFSTVVNVVAGISEEYEYTSLDADDFRVIIIDPGHGGEDPGAVTKSGVYEKDLNLAISLLIAEELMSQGYTVVLTRTEDKMLYSEAENIKGMRKLSDLKNRCRIAEEYEDALFVSIHMNSFAQVKYSGLQVYYAEGDDDSRNLANKIQSTVKSELQPSNNRTVKSGKNIYLLENCSATSVLVECGFLTNAEESQKLCEKEYQKELSFSIVCGIIEYMKQTEN